jgi:hypothetical protein
MALLPPSTNADYRGATVSAWFLVLLGALSIVPGIIHYFLPDGGAGVIAGIDLSTRRETIVAIFAWFGALQIPYGIGLVIVGLRYRPLTPLFITLVIVERGLMAIDGWLLKGAQGDHHPPEHYASVAAVVLGLIFLALSLKEKAPALARA